MASGSATTAVAWAALLAGGVALGLSLAGGAGGRGSDGVVEVMDDSDLFDREGLENRIHDAEVRLEAVEGTVRGLRETLARLEKEVREARDLARSAAAGGAGAGGGGAAGTVDGPGEGGDAGEALLRSLREGTFDPGGAFGLMERARELGVLDEALAAMEAWAKARPGDAAAQVALGTAYTVKLLAVPEGPARGQWATRALGAYDAALKIDPENWDARFQRAFNLSQWPDFLNRQPEAIRAFESLVEQQERSTPRPEHAQTYLQLGNTYRKAGNLEKAKEAFERGLRVFPDHGDLREQLELLK